jgi:myo-inositol 2-dehydrogenase/D-chiro-inositol 1-dehydrogenase
MAFRTSFDIAGDRGTVSFDSAGAGTRDENLCTTSATGSYLPPTSAEESPYLTQLREMAGAFLGGPLPRVCVADGIVAVALAQAAQASITAGTSIEFDTAAVLGADGPVR